MIILCDENFPCKIAEGIDIIESANKDTPIQLSFTHPYLLKKGGASDEEWIKFAGENNAIIFSFDKDFKDLKSKGRLYTQHNVGVFFFRYNRKEKIYWQTVKLIVNNMNEIKEKIIDTPAPFVYEISGKGVSRYEF